MLAKVRSATVLGVEGHPVRVEVHVAQGLPSFTIVGLPDASCRESRDRVRAAVQSSRFEWPQQRVTVNLAPTNLRKVGSGLDLAMAVGTPRRDPAALRTAHRGSLGYLGELGLDGTVRAVPGVLPALDRLDDVIPVVALANLAEARLVRPDARRRARACASSYSALRGEEPWPEPPPASAVPLEPTPTDLSDVQGHVIARTALEVAAAGGHHLLMTGPPGAGKTMLAERLVGHPARTSTSTAPSRSPGCTRWRRSCVPSTGCRTRPPFRSPHHTASLVAMVGGGSAMLRPGEISLASGGVLFLDELGEFPATHLDALRQPLEQGVIHLSRALHHVTLPGQLPAGGCHQPCPCGLGRWGPCTCTPAQLARYRRRLSGPLLDRFDLRIEVDPPDPADVFSAATPGESSGTVRQRVARRASPGGGPGRQRQPPSPRRCTRRRTRRSAQPVETCCATALGAGRLSMRGAQRVRAVALTLVRPGGRRRCRSARNDSARRWCCAVREPRAEQFA